MGHEAVVLAAVVVPVLVIEIKWRSLSKEALERIEGSEGEKGVCEGFRCRILEGLGCW